MITATFFISHMYGWLALTAFLLTVANMPAVKWMAVRFEIVAAPAATVLDSSMRR
ncbi:MAG: hypothetical protein IVW54_20825, partial [Candidatus Binataceae bacterium]|nr:hypothetical protein [Candidatus Binataceae bacterium]